MDLETQYHDPQNPYRSCVVRASAGSGKTYQLARRFLFLVGAGAHPASILTVTFTKKAAGEMRERILDMAAQLLSDPEQQQAFDRRLQDFYRLTTEPSQRPQPPRSALATAEAVLSSTQSLRIATIDAILLEWMRKFPYEAGGPGVFPSPFELMSQRDEERLHRRSWFLTVQALKAHGELAQRWQILSDKGLDLLDLEVRMRELTRHESFLWLLQKQRDPDSSLPSFLPHPLPAEEWDDSPGGFLRSMQGQLAEVCSLLAPAKAQQAIAYLQANDLEGLIELRVLTKNWELHNGTFRKPKRDRLESQISAINEQARALQSYKARAELNELGEFLLQLYQLYEEQQNRCKHEMGRLAFGDLIKGGYHLFNRPEAAGVRFLLHRTIRHLLLDEFQDTSILQWSMFSSMAGEMLAGEGLRGPEGMAASLFIVGDAKQSIYGFREAEAQVLQEAARFMLKREAWDISLSASYRSSPTLLSYINQVFSGQIADFPRHSTALNPDGSPRIKGAASLTIGPLFSEDLSPTPVADDATFIATFLQQLLNDPQSPPLWDKASHCYRRLEPGDCAILYRAATHATVYAEALRTAGIAARMEEGHSFFERLEIRDLMAFCRWMSLPSHTEAFVHMLKSPLFRIADSSLIHALYQVPSQHLSRYERHLRLLDVLSETYPAVVARLQELLQARSRSRPQSLLRSAADQGSWTQAYQKSFGAEEGALAAANLARFLDTVSSLEAQGCYDWLPLYEKLEELAAEKAVSLATVSENAVQLMTIHKAKGLEFPLVVVAGTGEEWEKTDPYWAKIKESPLGSGMAYVGRRSDRPAADSHFDKLAELLHHESYQENLRLLYVALTRAQYHLLITGHQRKKRRSGFYELLRTAALAKSAQELSPAWNGTAPSLLQIVDPPVGVLSGQARPSEPGRPLQQLLAWVTPPARLGAIRILAPARLLDDFETTAGKSSGAHRFATEIGTFIHQGLEALVKAQPFHAAEAWKNLGLQHEPEAFAASFAYAQQKLTALQCSPSLLKLLDSSLQRHAELPIAFLYGDQLVRGTIDLLLQRGPEHWQVIDYKTSEEAAHVSDLKALAASKRYDQQLALYMQGVQLLYPRARVDGAIFFTEREEFVSFNQALIRRS